MRLKYSPHAKDQIKYRNIPFSKIRPTVKSPEKIIFSYKTRKLYQKTFGKKTLEVVVVEKGDIMIVVTCYYLYEN